MAIYKIGLLSLKKKYDIDFDQSEFDYIVEIDKFYEEKKRKILQ